MMIVMMMFDVNDVTGAAERKNDKTEPTFTKI